MAEPSDDPREPGWYPDPGHPGYERFGPPDPPGASIDQRATYAAGWYPDPWEPRRLRCYDGASWTPSTRAAPWPRAAWYLLAIGVLTIVVGAVLVARSWVPEPEHPCTVADEYFFGLTTVGWLPWVVLAGVAALLTRTFWPRLTAPFYPEWVNAFVPVALTWAVVVMLLPPVGAIFLFAGSECF